ncbi:MAG: PAS domain-containing protein [Bryobacterales bacterium]|nr:PAS domain-containing protein [Bryobacterales bacterium]
MPSMKAKSSTSSEPTVIGIGASAGGLAALKTFLAQLPEDSGLAVVVVVHLSPDHESRMAELLQPHVRLNVQQVSETVRIEANHVYVIPPNANLNAIDTHLRLSKLEEQRRERAPIDHFFRTLARAHDGHSIAVILTGTGSDGTLGIKDIKANGGVVIVQDPNEAEYDGMPQSAIATGMVDLILQVAEIPDAILRFAATEPRVSNGNREDVPQDERVLLQNILAQLRVRTDRDFSRYKPATLLRRIARRMQLNHVEDLRTYAETIRNRIEEAHSLVDDLLITVTHFFRDAEVFKKLEKDLVPKIFARKTSQDAVRIWSAGCATGEEAYSLAMIFAEAAGKFEAPPRIQIFASDLHPGSLNRARAGIFSADIETDVGSERLARFFQKDQGGYRIRKEIRDLVVFSPHNILSDPPFSRMDLISCRNLLIYLEREVQKEVIEIFHYALNPEGVLLLGTAESIEASDQFRAVDKKLCMFTKRNTPVREPRLPVFPLTRNRLSGDGKSATQRREAIAAGNLHQRMVEQYAPPSILVGPDNRLVHLSQHAGRFMMLPGGEPTASVLKLVRDELQLELQAALHEAREKRRTVDTKPIPVRFEGHPCPVVMHVRPALEPVQEGYILIIFEEREAHEADASPAESDGATGSSAELIADLRAQLADAHRQTQTVIEEFENTREQMSASSEEIQSTNEELRSTLEELETSKEELQSINEELQTVNQQNRHKVDELAQLSGDLQNLLSATDIATLFLDRNLRILRFTPKLGELFNVRLSDCGRPIGDLTHRLGYPELRSDAEAVLSRLVPLERELKDEAGRWYLTRVLPYRSTEDRIDGVVITFIDIDARKKAEDTVTAGADRLRRMINVDVVGVMIFDESGTLIEGNETFQKMSGYSKDEISSGTLSWRSMTPPEYVEVSERQLENLAATGRVGPYEKEYTRKDGSRWWMIFAGASLGDGTTIEYCIDVSDRKRAEREVLESKYYAESIIESLHEPLLVLTPDFKVLSANPAFYRHFEVDPAETVGRKIYDLGNGQWNIPALRTLLEDVLPANNSFDEFEMEHTFESIGTRAMLVNARRLAHVDLILLGLRDITERKRLENDARAANRELVIANNALERANIDLQHFSYAVSHDMQESLRMVMSYTQLLARDYATGLDAEARQYIEYAVLGASRMESLLTGLRNYWSVSERKIDKLDAIDCNEAVDQALEFLELTLKESGAKVTHDYLPTIAGEQHPLTLLFQNLISNALKYRHPERAPRVHISARRQDAAWIFSVTDNGIGIEPKDFESIFVPFKRLNRGTHPGTGLGLAMCRRIVERYHGQILVNSANGQGSTFQFTVPDSSGEA